jgi:small nuclear ribonucleoprotein (snRNP)-like protein
MEPLDFISRSFVFNITDGRTIEGILIAIDDQSNLLVTNATESKDNHRRELGLVSIRKETIDKISITKKEYKEIFA